MKVAGLGIGATLRNATHLYRSHAQPVSVSTCKVVSDQRPPVEQTNGDGALGNEPMALVHSTSLHRASSAISGSRSLPHLWQRPHFVPVSTAKIGQRHRSHESQLDAHTCIRPLCFRFSVLLLSLSICFWSIVLSSLLSDDPSL